MIYETMSGLGGTLITDSCSIPKWEVLGPLFLSQGIVSAITGNPSFILCTYFKGKHHLLPRLSGDFGTDKQSKFKV